MSGPLEVQLTSAVRALFTTRAQGNMSSVGGLGAELGAANRDSIRRRAGARNLARAFQVHGTSVLELAEPTADAPTSEGLPEADGLLSALPGQAAMVLAADCLPVVLASDGAYAVLHAGWRGLAGGILERGVAALGQAGEDAVAGALGPCAGACCYEVGPEVHAALGQPGRGRGPADLRAIARERLQRAGVREISELGGCTICDESYFSYRREGAAAGRMAGVGWLS